MESIPRGATEKAVPFFRTRAFGVFVMWVLIIVAVLGTYFLSRNIEGRSGNAAATFFGAGGTREISLYADRAEPASIEARVGEEIVFVVRDESRHNIAEHRKRKTDARLESGEFRKGESYSLVFSGEGAYSFYDRLNQEIQVTITVR